MHRARAMRRLGSMASVVVMAVTAWLLIATSRGTPCSATSATVMGTARTTCGPDAPVTVTTSSTSCSVTVTGARDAGLPDEAVSTATGGIRLSGPIGPVNDAGIEPSAICSLTPSDAGTGWDVLCDRTFCNEVNAGCTDVCSGTIQ